MAFPTTFFHAAASLRIHNHTCFASLQRERAQRLTLLGAGEKTHDTQHNRMAFVVEVRHVL